MIYQWKDIGEFLSDARTNQTITHGKCKFSKSREGKNKGKNKLKNERKKKFIQCFSAARKVVTINRFVKTFLYPAQLHDSVLAHILWGTSPVWVFCRMSSAHLSQAKSPQMGELSVFRTVECEQLILWLVLSPFRQAECESGPGDELLLHLCYRPFLALLSTLEFFSTWYFCLHKSGDSWQERRTQGFSWWDFAHTVQWLKLWYIQELFEGTPNTAPSWWAMSSQMLLLSM